MEGQHLGRCDHVRDLGVLLDTKLTFAAHVDATVTKANRMLGMLMRSMQMPKCPRRVRFNHAALLSAFNAHVRSVMEYGSVIWSGAAVTHLARFERLQHRFLIWLASNTRHRRPSLDYDSLLSHFCVPSIKARLVQTDLVFLHDIFHNQLDCPHLTSLFGLATPARRSRHTGLFHIPFGRVSTVKSAFTTRIPAACNQLLQDNPTADFFHPSSRSYIRRFASSLDTFIS